MDPITESSLDREVGTDGVTTGWRFWEAVKTQEVLTGEVDHWVCLQESISPWLLPATPFPATAIEVSSCAVSWPLCSGIWLQNDSISVVSTESSETLSRSLLL